MTIASEITRLQWAKADIKTAIENKWVSVPANVKLDSYDDYISQITSGTIPTMFTPASLVYSRVFQSSYNWMAWRPRALAYEGLDTTETAYYNYFFTMVDSSSAGSYGRPYIIVLRKTWGSNWTTTVYTWPEYSNSNAYDYPAVYETFALNNNGTLKVYIIFHVDHYTSYKYSWEDVWIRDITSGCSVLDSSFIAAIAPAWKDTEAVNAKIEELKQSVWYYTYPVLSNGGATSSPSIDWNDHWYDFTYTLNLVNS